MDALFTILPPWITALHDQAMDVADDADVARRRGQKSPLYQTACRNETLVALACLPTLQPSRSVLLRSAASLALDAEWLTAAHRLAVTGLQPDTRADIEAELREVLASAEPGQVPPPVWVNEKVRIDLPLPEHVNGVGDVVQILGGALCAVRCTFVDGGEPFYLYIPTNALFPAEERR